MSHEGPANCIHVLIYQNLASAEFSDDVSTYGLHAARWTSLSDSHWGFKMRPQFKSKITCSQFLSIYLQPNTAVPVYWLPIGLCIAYFLLAAFSVHRNLKESLDSCHCSSTLFMIFRGDSLLTEYSVLFMVTLLTSSSSFALPTLASNVPRLSDFASSAHFEALHIHQFLHICLFLHILMQSPARH